MPLHFTDSDAAPARLAGMDRYTYTAWRRWERVGVGRSGKGGNGVVLLRRHSCGLPSSGQQRARRVSAELHGCRVGNWCAGGTTAASVSSRLTLEHSPGVSVSRTRALLSTWCTRPPWRRQRETRAPRRRTLCRQRRLWPAGRGAPRLGGGTMARGHDGRAHVCVCVCVCACVCVAGGLVQGRARESRVRREDNTERDEREKARLWSEEGRQHRQGARASRSQRKALLPHSTRCGLRAGGRCWRRRARLPSKAEARRWRFWRRAAGGGGGSGGAARAPGGVLGERRSAGGSRAGERDGEKVKEKKQERQRHFFSFRALSLCPFPFPFPFLLLLLLSLSLSLPKRSSEQCAPAH